MNNITAFRGEFEDLYGEQVLNPDIIETLVNEFVKSAAYLRTREGLADPADIMGEAKILRHTLTWSSNYNRGTKQ